METNIIIELAARSIDELDFLFLSLSPGILNKRRHFQSINMLGFE